MEVLVADPPTEEGRGEVKRVYALIMLLSLPFWILGMVFRVELLPGLPLSALTFVVPALAGILYLLLARRKEAIGKVLAKIGRPSSPWELAAFLLMPALLLASYLIDRALGRAEAFGGPELGRTGALLLLFLVAALGEEFAWTGLFLRRSDGGNRRRRALLIASLYCLWHALPFLQTSHGLVWVAEQLAFSFLFRLLIVNIIFLFGFRTVLAVLLHASYNLAWQLYPVSGSSYDPLLAALLAAAALIITEVLLVLRVAAVKEGR